MRALSCLASVLCLGDLFMLLRAVVVCSFSLSDGIYSSFVSAAQYADLPSAAACLGPFCAACKHPCIVLVRTCAFLLGMCQG